MRCKATPLHPVAYFPDNVINRIEFLVGDAELDRQCADSLLGCVQLVLGPCTFLCADIANSPYFLKQVPASLSRGLWVASELVDLPEINFRMSEGNI